MAARKKLAAAQAKLQNGRNKNLEKLLEPHLDVHGSHRNYLVHWFITYLRNLHRGYNQVTKYHGHRSTPQKKPKRIDYILDPAVTPSPKKRWLTLFTVLIYIYIYVYLY